MTGTEQWVVVEGARSPAAPPDAWHLSLENSSSRVAFPELLAALKQSPVFTRDALRIVHAMLEVERREYRAAAHDRLPTIHLVLDVEAQQMWQHPGLRQAVEQCLRVVMGLPVVLELKPVTVPSRSSAPTQEGAHELRPAGDAWVVRFAGGPRISLRPLKGLAYLRFLLDRPGEDFTAFALIDLYEGRAPHARPHASPPSADAATLRTVRRARVKLIERREQAVADGDLNRVEQIAQELAHFDRYLRGEERSAGRPRTETSDQRKARVAVTNAIRRAIEVIARHDPRCGDHLREQIKTGFTLRYRDHQTSWTT